MEGRPYWIAIGDLHDDVSQIGNVPGISEAQGVLISGDITNYGNRARAERLLGEIERFNPKILAQIGNMDTQDVEDFLEQRGIMFMQGHRPRFQYRPCRGRLFHADALWNPF